MGTQFWQGVMAATAGWFGLSLVTCAAFSWLMHRTPVESDDTDGEQPELQKPSAVAPKAPTKITRTAA